MSTLTATDFERSGSWNLVIAAELLRKDGEETPYHDEDKERKWGSLSICRQSGAWYSWAAARGGYDALSLIRFLRPDYDHEDPVRWLVKFLAANPGTGQLEADIGEWTETRRLANSELGRHYLDVSIPLPEDSRGAQYLAGRGLPPPYPSFIRWYPDARVGEGAIVVPLIDNARPVAAMLTYIDGLGAKSTVEPIRRRFNIEPDHPGAVMEIAVATPGTIDISADVIICEGLENGLSIARVKSPAWRIVALPGIHTLKHVMLERAERRVIVFQDSDPKGHPARTGLEAGVDAMLLAEKEVRVTEHSDHGDANSILQTEGLGEKELKRLLAKPAGAALSFKGKVEELSKLPETEYMQARREVAKGLGVPVAYLDKEVLKRRPKPDDADEGSAEPSISLPVDPPWTGPVPQLGPLLDRIVTEIRRYVVLQEWQAHIVAVWVALTYFVFDMRIDLQVCPRLAIQSAAINSGKTALLRIVCTLVRHGKIYGRATSAGIYRALSQAELTLCLDEVEFLRNDPYSPMMQVLDSSHHREDANILLTEPQKVGPPIARELSTWAAMALACNGQLPGSLQSRSIVVVLLRALASEDHEFLEKRSTPELIGLRRELTAWAATITELPFPSRSEMPAEVYNRDGDNLRPMYAIGQLAGGPWPDRIREASLKAVKTETLPPLITSLLSSVDRAFGDNPQPNTWLDTAELVARLLAQEGEPWGKVNRGGPIDPYWLRAKFINLLNPPGAQDWWQPVKGGRRKHRSGYFYNQFADAFRRFPEPPAGIFDPGETHAETSPEMTGASGASREKPPSPRKTAIFDAPDGPGASGADRVHQKASKSAAVEPLTPLAPDAPEDSTPSSVCVSEPDEWSWADGAVEQSSTTEPATPPENRNTSPRPPARPRRAKPNGGDPDSSVAKSRAAVLDMPEPSLIDYIEGSIADDIRQLRAANPKRSLKWIAKQSGQPPSVVRGILGNWEGAQ
jgi:hypothetical protein